FDHVVPGHAEVLPVDPGVRLEAAAVSAAVAWTEAEDVDVEHHRLGDAADRQVAGDLELVRGGLLHRGGLEGELRVLGDVEESVAAQVLVARRLVGVDAAGIDRHLHGALGPVVPVDDDLPLELGETSGHPAEQVPDGEGDGAVRRIDRVRLGDCDGRCDGKAQRRYGEGTQCQVADGVESVHRRASSLWGREYYNSPARLNRRSSDGRRGGEVSAQFRWRPPSTRRHSPVTNPVSTKNSTARAISSGPPQRPSGVTRRTARSALALNPGGLRIGPGAMAFTRISGPPSLAFTARTAAAAPDALDRSALTIRERDPSERTRPADSSALARDRL